MFMELESVDGKFCSEQWKAMKLLIMEDYDCHMHYMDKGDRMASSEPLHKEVDKEIALTSVILDIPKSYVLFFM